MSKHRYELTQSLLSSWLYATDPEAAERSWDEFIDALERKPKVPNEAMKDGIEFERLVTLHAAGKPFDVDNEDWFKAAMQVGNICKGAIPQVRIEKDVQIRGIDFRLIGVADFVKAGRIYDVKKVLKYECPKYFHSPQHPMYFELIPEAKVFQYLIFDGKYVYREQYHPGDGLDIYATISAFIDFLFDRNLLSKYFEKWRIMQ